MMWIVLFIVLDVHLLYYIYIFLRVATAERQEIQEDAADNASLVICCKNEVKQIKDLLDSLQHQGLSDIIIVDDYSTDGTYELLQSYASSIIKIMRPSADVAGKKLALAEGIAAARYDRILLTDADCIPATNQWAAAMLSHNKPIVLGYGPMRKATSAVNLFSRFETYMTGIQYLGYARIGRPYMGVGRNMVIDRSLKAEHSDKIQGKSLLGGDDDLTINAIATEENCTVCLDHASFTYSDTRETWRGFIRQKVRHISTSTYYKPMDKLLLAAFSGSQILFYLILLISLMMGTIDLPIAFVIFVMKQAIQIAIHRKVQPVLKEQFSIIQLVILDIGLFIYYLAMPFIILISKKQTTWS